MLDKMGEGEARRETLAKCIHAIARDAPWSEKVPDALDLIPDRALRAMCLLLLIFPLLFSSACIP